MQLKQFLVFLPFFILVVPGCQQTDDRDTNERIEAQQLPSNDQTSQFETPSNTYFRQAKEAYRQGDLSRAAEDISLGAEAWHRETPQIDSMKQIRDNMLSKLQTLANHAKAGEVANINQLNDLFSEAELLCARLELGKSISLFQNEQHEQATQQGKQAIARVDEMLTYTGRTIGQHTRDILDEAVGLLNNTKQSTANDHTALSQTLDNVQTALAALIEPADVVQNTDTVYTDSP